jgi:hypothetical protein
MAQDVTILDNSLVQRRGVGPQTFFTSTGQNNVGLILNEWLEKHQKHN